MKKTWYVSGMIVLLLVHAATAANAQENTVDSPKKTKEKKYSIIPMPVIAANPTTGLMLGISPGVTWVQGDPKTTSMSNYLGGLIFTTKKQILTTLRGTLFFEGDKWVLMSDMRYNINRLPTFGLSTKPQLTDESIVGGRMLMKVFRMVPTPVKC